MSRRLRSPTLAGVGLTTSTHLGTNVAPGGAMPRRSKHGALEANAGIYRKAINDGAAMTCVSSSWVTANTNATIASERCGRMSRPKPPR